jgi:hypothetical protein
MGNNRIQVQQLKDRFNKAEGEGDITTETVHAKRTENIGKNWRVVVFPKEKKSEYTPIAGKAEINDALRFMARNFSDRAYRILSEYFAENTFVLEPHPLAGMPVSLLTYKEKDELSEDPIEKIFGKYVEENPRLEKFKNYFTGPLFTYEAIRKKFDELSIRGMEHYEPGTKFTDKQQAAITQYERTHGYDFDTTLLRKEMGIHYLAPYQVYVILNLRHYNYLVTPRRSGKSILLTYIGSRQTFLPGNDVLYMVPNESFFDQPMMYLSRLTKRITDTDPNIKVVGKKLQNRETQSHMLLVSALKKHGVRSYDAGMVIIDEASFVPKKEFLNTVPIIQQKMGITGYGVMICCSTLDPESTEKNWFYENLIEAEIKSLEIAGKLDHISVRVPLSEVPFYTQEAKESMLEKFKDDEAAMRCEALCEYPPSNSRIPGSFFPVSFTEGKPITTYSETGDLDVPYFVPPEGELLKIVLGWDIAKKLSRSALSVMGVYRTIKGLETARICIFGCSNLPMRMSYSDQCKKVIMPFMEELSKYVKNSEDVILAYDVTGVGEAVREIIEFHGINAFPVYSYRGRAAAKNKVKFENGQLTLDKSVLIRNFTEAAESGRTVSFNLALVFQLIKDMGKVDISDYSQTETNEVLKNDILNSISIAHSYIKKIYPTLLAQVPVPIEENASGKRNLQMLRQRFLSRNSIGTSKKDRLSSFGY